MKSALIQSRREAIAAALQQTHQYTLDLLAQVDESLFFKQAHPDFSPIGWHFGHIAFIEAFWILEHLAHFPPSFPEHQLLFAADGLPKQERQNLPDKSTIEEYLQDIKAKTLKYLKTAPIEQQLRLWWWLIQHESQHGEIISIILQLHRLRDRTSPSLSLSNFANPNTSDITREALSSDLVRVEAGEFTMGSNAIAALDNERPAHQLYLDTYWIDRYPVTCGQYARFMTAGGYQKREYWSQAGWQWLEQNPVSQPLYWLDTGDWIDHPVYGVSYYEAEAYANFAEKRLPTEAEWAKAALGYRGNCNHSRAIGHTTPVNTYTATSQYGCQDMLGNVWEWTASWFAGYPEFTFYPYQGYSAAYFDRQHRVLRGGSWATNSSALRTSFRNWYHPEVRQIFAGFRCAKND